MSFQLSAQRVNAQPRVRWQAAAYLIEAMLLLLFFMVSLAVLTAMYAESIDRSTQGADLTEAVAMATSAAERFSADPSAALAQEQSDGLVMECTVVPEKRDAGTLYKATISVYKAADLESARAAAAAAEGEGEGEGESARAVPADGGKTAPEPPLRDITPVYRLSTSAYESGV